MSLRVRQIWGKAETDNRVRRHGRSDLVAGRRKTARAPMSARKSCRTRSTLQYMVGYSWARQPGTAAAAEALATRTSWARRSRSPSRPSRRRSRSSPTRRPMLPANFFFGGAGPGRRSVRGRGCGRGQCSRHAALTTTPTIFAPDVVTKIAFDFQSTRTRRSAAWRASSAIGIYPGLSTGPANATPAVVQRYANAN